MQSTGQQCEFPSKGTKLDLDFFTNLVATSSHLIMGIKGSKFVLSMMVIMELENVLG